MGGFLFLMYMTDYFFYVKLKISSTSYSEIFISMIFVIYFRFSFLLFISAKAY